MVEIADCSVHERSITTAQPGDRDQPFDRRFKKLLNIHSITRLLQPFAINDFRSLLSLNLNMASKPSVRRFQAANCMLHDHEVNNTLAKDRREIIGII